MPSIFRKFNYPAAAVVLSGFLFSTNPSPIMAQDSAVANPPLPDAVPASFSIAEEWTANVLPARSFSFGSIVEAGLGSSIALGIDPAA